MDNSNCDIWAGIPRAYYLLPALGHGALNIVEITTEQECSLIGQEKEKCYILSEQALNYVGPISQNATILSPGEPSSIGAPTLAWKNWPHRMESMPGLITQDRDLGRILNSLWTPYSRLGGLFVDLSKVAAPYVAKLLPTKFSLFASIQPEAKVVAAFVGTKSAKQKVAAIVRFGESLVFRKSSALPGGREALRREYDALMSLKDSTFERIYIPKALDLVEHKDSKLMSLFSNIHSLSSCKGPRELDERHFTLLSFFAKEKQSRSSADKTLDSLFRSIEDSCEFKLAALLKMAYQQGKQRYQKLSADSPRACFAHGDFVCWNTRKTKESLWVFDWEFSLSTAPRELDLFHFTVWPWVVTGSGSLKEKWQSFAAGSKVLEWKMDQDQIAWLFCFAMVHWVCLLTGEYPGDDAFRRMQEVQQFSSEARI